MRSSLQIERRSGTGEEIMVAHSMDVSVGPGTAPEYEGQIPQHCTNNEMGK